MLGVPNEEKSSPSNRLEVAVLKRAFYRTDPVTCARALVGCRLQWGTRSGRVVETEAYDSEGDEASHTFFRPSARRFIEDHCEGAAYVYFNYGMHWMLNVLVKGGPRTGFVLIRALEPLTGIDEMRQARGKTELHLLCSGPGKLAQALGVTGADHGRDLCEDRNFAFHAGTGVSAVLASPRVGITRAVEFPWRFFAAENRHVSAHPKGWKRENARGGKPAE
jgi:DNA-3-methyladenine glycosylase